MDKKSFLLILLFSFALFFVNNFLFDRKKETPTEAVMPGIDFTARTHKLEELPLVTLFSDKEGTKEAVYALSFEDFFITDYQEELPKTLYYKGKPLVLVTPSVKNAPLCYGTSEAVVASFGPKQVPESIDLQFVSHFSLGSNLTNTLGEYQNGKTTFPDKPLEENAIALYRSSHGWIPFGYWSKEKGSFKRFSEAAQYEKIRSTVDIEDPFANEKLYVLENEYQQVVFSTYGGAISEVNLPFQEKGGVIQPIEFDEDIEKRYPENNSFPLQSYYALTDAGKTELTAPKNGGYMPLLRRSLKDDSGKVIYAFPPLYYLANLVTEDIDMETVHFTVTKFTKEMIEMQARLPYRTFKKQFRFVKGAPYTLELTTTIEGNPGAFWLTSGVPEVELISGSATPSLEYYSLLANKKKKMQRIKIPKQITSIPVSDPLWISNANGFFGVIIGPTEAIKEANIRVEPLTGSAVRTRLSLIDSEYDLYPTNNYPGYCVEIPFPASSSSMTYRIFAGPFEETVLNSVDKALANGSDGENPNFSKAISVQQGWLGWLNFITEPFAKFLFVLMNFFHTITGSWGLSIIFLTLVLRILLYPLSNWSFKSNLKMQKLAPKIKALQEKYKKDPKRMQMETAMLYKTEGVNPFSGCLPLLIQFPFLIGMFDLLKSTFVLRGASFIPGWIDNLTSPDILFSWSYPIIFFGTSFHLLPVILGGLMYVQQRINFVQQEKKGALSDQQKQMKSMGNIMTIVFLFFFYNLPSGLNIYWIFSTIFGILQQWWFMKHIPNTK